MEARRDQARKGLTSLQRRGCQWWQAKPWQLGSRLNQAFSVTIGCSKEWNFSDADAVEECRRRRRRDPDPARHGNNDWSEESQNRLAQESSLFCIRTYGGVAELSARLWLTKSKPSVLCLTETWAHKGLPTIRVDGNTPKPRFDQVDGRQGGWETPRWLSVAG